MAKFLATSGVANGIDIIISKAKTELVLLSPFMKLSKALFERLKEANDKGVKINIICRGDDLQEADRKKLSGLNKLNVYSRDDLHAKCYFNEDRMVITSMNLHEFSEKNNREIGIFITKDGDEKLFNEALEEYESIKRGSKQVPLTFRSKIYKADRKSRGTKRVGSSKGYCIRCGERIPKNKDYPFCPPCYRIWSMYNNPEYPENCCHFCGREAITSLYKPLCTPCFNAEVKSL